MYLGDFTTANTVYVGFNTFDSNDPSASVTLTGLAVGDIKVYKNGSTTERSSTAGFTLLDTDGTDFDGNTGIHGFSLDLSDNTDSGFYAAGGEYMVVVASVTVDGATVNFIAATFSIERTGGALALLKGTNSLSDIEGKIDTLTSDLTAVKTKTDYLPSVTAGASGGLFIAGTNAATTITTGLTTTFTGNLTGSVGSVTGAVGSVTGNVGGNVTGSVGSVTGAVGSVTGSVTIDGTSVDLIWDETLTGHVTSDSAGVAVKDILADTNELQTDDYPATLATLATASALATVDTVVDGIQADLSNGTDGLGAIKADTAAILVDTAEIGAAGAGLTAIPWNASWDAEVQSECTDALNAYDPPTNTEMTAAFTEIKGATFSSTDTLEAIRDRGDAAWTTGAGGSAPTVEEIRAEIDSNSTQLAAILADTAEIGAAGAGLTALATASALATVDSYVDAILVDTGTTIPASIDALPTAAENRAEMDSNSTQLAAIVADTGELQTDWANGGRLDLLIDAIKVVTDALPDSGALTSLATAAALATVDSNLDAVLVDTGTDIPAAIAALNDLAASDILNTQLTESYAAYGTDPTLSQAIFLIQQFLYERSTSGTTVTVKKLDGSTTAATLTLDDDTSPTSITRAS